MSRPRQFDEAALASAGLSVVRRLGWAKVSIRSIAEELGVSPMALYRLAPDAESLYRLIANAVSSSIQPSSDDASLASTLRKWAIVAHAHLERHPGVASFVLGNWTELPGWLDIVEGLLAKAEGEGILGPRAVAVVNAVFAYVLARAQLRDGILAATRRELAPLAGNPSRYRLLNENRNEFAVAQTEKHFLFGLDSLLAGMIVQRER